MNKFLLLLSLIFLGSCTDVFNDGPYRYDGTWKLVSAYTEYQKMIEYDNADEIIAVEFASVDTSLRIHYPAVHAVDSVNISDTWTFIAENSWLVVNKKGVSDTVTYELLRHPQVVFKINYPVFQEQGGFVTLSYWSVKPMILTYIDHDSMVLRTSGVYIDNGDLRSESQLSFVRP